MDSRIAPANLDFLFRAHNDEALRLATRMVGAQERGEDVVMSVWLRLTALLSRREEGSHPMLSEQPRGYIFRAVRNMAIDHLIRQRREAEHRVEVEDLDLLAGVAHAADAVLEQRRRIAALACAINALPDASRRAFILCRLHDLPHRDIAERLGVSVSMVEKHMIRAMRACRAALADPE